MRALFTCVGGEGHLRPLLPLARAAAAEGHAVTVAGAAALAPVAAAARLPFVPLEPDVLPQRTALRPVDLGRERRVVGDAFAGWMARARAPGLLGLCARLRPDLLVRDELDFAAAVVAERLGLPQATVLVTAAGGFVRHAIVAAPLARLRAEHGLGPDARLAMLTRGLVLAPFPPSFRDPAHPLPETARAFRAATRVEATTRAVPERLGRPPFLYVTLGTIFNTESGDLLPRILAGVCALGLDVVVTVGRTLDPAALGPQPDHVHIARHVPMPRLLPHCAAVVAHGGSGTVIGALAHGLPLVCVPLGADQPLNADRCAALGAGVALDALAASPEDFRLAAGAVLEQASYREAAARLQDEIARLPGPVEVLPDLERLCA